jgi:transcriptional regulator with XRE-family HTH domain
MNTEFPRILTLLRKEKGISQKSAATQLSISQALLSHYEKGIRECGLDFLVRCAHFYDVSCDYLLGLSPDRKGHTLALEDIPEPEEIGKENRLVTGVLPVLNKKLIANSLNVLYDLLTKAQCRSLTGEVSAFLTLAVYRMFRVVYAANPKNQEAMFGVPSHVCARYADAAMQLSEANATSVAQGQPIHGFESLEQVESLAISTEQLGEEYPLFAPSLLNLIQTAERRIGYKEKAKKQD